MTARQAIEQRLGRLEFTALISMVMAVVALAIDMMLPAFGDMRGHFGLAEDSNALAPIVTFFFIGLAMGQPVWGPLSDALGRKRILYTGLAIYVAAAAAAAFSPNLAVLFGLRLVGGFGAAGPRVVAQSIVRDAYEGAAMAKVLSYIMAIFILVPVIAPTIGTAVLALGTWQMVFVVIAAFGIGVGLWATRLPETLDPARRLPLDFRRLVAATARVARDRFTMGLTLAQSVLFGFFASYLATSQLLIDDVFGLSAWFPLIFGASAAIIGVGMILNTRLLGVASLRTILRGVFTTYVVATAAFLVLAIATDGTPPFAAFTVALVPILFAHALLIPNLNSAALAPMGAIAGTAAAVIGTVSTLGGALIGAVIDSRYDNTLLPLATAGAIAALTALGLFLWADRVWVEPTTEPMDLPLDSTI
jgi:DHA1 family bicyclomycin/chloramphenicol resistance-like MFS transporter